MRVTYIDTELTGLDIINHEIIQFGYLVFEDGIQIEKGEFNIKPANPDRVDPEALKVNGFKPSDWENWHMFPVYKNAVKWIIERSDILIGQRLYTDLKFIKQAFANIGEACPKFPKYIDTKYLASKLVENGVIRNSSLEVSCAHYNIVSSGKSHTALTDCERTARVYERLAADVKDSTFFTYEKPYDPQHSR